MNVKNLTLAYTSTGYTQLIDAAIELGCRCTNYNQLTLPQRYYLEVHKYKVHDLVKLVNKARVANYGLSKITVNGNMMLITLPVDTLCRIVEITEDYKYYYVTPIVEPINKLFKVKESDFLPAPESAQVLFGG